MWNLDKHAREKLEELIDRLYEKHLHGKKPRAYKVIARADYLGCVQKKEKTKQQVGTAVRKQLRYVKRYFEHLYGLLDAYDTKGLPFPEAQGAKILLCGAFPLRPANGNVRHGSKVR